MKYKLIKVKYLTGLARKIFGDDLIKDSWLEVGIDDNHDYSQLFLKDHNDNNQSNIDYDTHTIIIEFINGNKVSFTNSEWASIKLIK